MLRDNISKMKDIFTQPGKYYTDNKQHMRSYSVALSNKALFFIPGVFFLILGIVAIAAPMLLIAAVSVFFVFFGIFFTIIALKFLKLKRKIDGMTQELKSQMTGKIFVHGVEILDADDLDLEQEFGDDDDFPSKKIILH